MARGYPDFEGPKAGVYAIAEWAAKEGKDKNFGDIATPCVSGAGVSVLYTVPTGKTLYITQVSWAVFASDLANRELNQMGYCAVSIFGAPSTFLWRQAGNGGGGISFPKPLIIKGDSLAQMNAYNVSNHACTVIIAVGGYEV